MSWEKLEFIYYKILVTIACLISILLMWTTIHWIVALIATLGWLLVIWETWTKIYMKEER